MELLCKVESRNCNYVTSGVVRKWIFVNVLSWSRCYFKQSSVFGISANCRRAGTRFHVNNSYLGRQPHLTRELHQCVAEGAGVNVLLYRQPYLTIPTKIRLSRRTISRWHRKRGRWSRNRRMTAQMYYSFIHHPSLFPPLIILSPAKKEKKEKKGRAWPVFFCLCKCHVSERDWSCADGKGCIFSLNLDFIYSHWCCVMELSCKCRQHRWKWETSRWESHRGRHSGTES